MQKFVLFSVLLSSTLALPQRIHFPRKLNLSPENQNPEESMIVPIVVPEDLNSRNGRNYVPNEFERHQNEAAKYEFSSDIEDHINDLTHQRTETRNGLSVKGMYSYSDGYYKHTVHYEADQNGYRVTGMERVPLSDGPKIDLTGSASVSNAAHGTAISYKVHSVPVEGPVAKIVDQY